ncbi:pygopus homolog 2-like [Symsagittifera roscoffensis]|uniref:pygopus homolog 2-like n=1 Tax=Symsagittifera roscoffensis TaxID=84072 RepID=UPI00307B282C
MTGMQPPTPKEDLVAKNPFETDFDIPGGGGGSTQQVSSFFNYPQNAASNFDPMGNSYGPPRLPGGYMSNSNHVQMYTGQGSSPGIPGPRQFAYPNVPYPNQMGQPDMGPQTGYNGDPLKSPFMKSSASSPIRSSFSESAVNLTQPGQMHPSSPSVQKSGDKGGASLESKSNPKSSSKSNAANKNTHDNRNNQFSQISTSRQSNSSNSTMFANNPMSASNLQAAPVTSNVNAPITHLNIAICAICRQDILEGDDRLTCLSGCSSNAYHRMCAGLSKNAYELFRKESNVEWVCDYCISSRQIPLIKTLQAPGPVSQQHQGLNRTATQISAVPAA